MNNDEFIEWLYKQQKIIEKIKLEKWFIQHKKYINDDIFIQQFNRQLKIFTKFNYKIHKRIL